MARMELRLDGEAAWELDYHLPVLWPWLFDLGAITESRRLFSTVFDAAARFEERVALLTASAYFSAIAGVVAEELHPDQFPRALGVQPDAILSLDLREFENQRPYKYEAAALLWQEFFTAVQARDEGTARELWVKASLSPLVLSGGKQRDALMFAARAEELGLDRRDRAQALVWLLFGQPASRAARSLEHRWTARAGELPAAHYSPKKRWWKRLGGWGGGASE